MASGARRSTPPTEDVDGHVPVSNRWPHALNGDRMDVIFLPHCRLVASFCYDLLRMSTCVVKEVAKKTVSQHIVHIHTSSIFFESEANITINHHTKHVSIFNGPQNWVHMIRPVQKLLKLRSGEPSITALTDISLGVLKELGAGYFSHHSSWRLVGGRFVRVSF